MSLMLRHTARRRPGAGGFTLVELLVVISVIGVLAAIGIAAITNIHQAAKESRNLRNAQFATFVFASAQAAGASFTSPAGDVEGVVRELNEGKTGKGDLSNAFFRLPTMPIQDTDQMISLLQYDPALGGLMMRVDR